VITAASSTITNALCTCWVIIHAGNTVNTTMSSSHQQAYQARHADTLLYLRQFMRTADIPSRQRLRSSITDSLFVPAVRLSTVERHAFPVAGACIWNDLPSDITTILFLLIFKQRLKMH